MTQDGIKRFNAHFKMPKKKIEQLKKDFADKKVGEERTPKDPEKLKNFTAMSEELFDEYELISGRKSRRDVLSDHLFYWFDEGFEMPEMKNYMRAEYSSDWHKLHPAKYTISNLFPVENVDRIQITWDLLSYELMKLSQIHKKKEEIFSTHSLIRRECGHEQKIEAYRKNEACVLCKDSELACIIEPYVMMPVVETNELRELCWFFMRQNQESLSEYAIRTQKRRMEIYKKYGIKAKEDIRNVLNSIENIKIKEPDYDAQRKDDQIDFGSKL